MPSRSDSVSTIVGGKYRDLHRWRGRLFPGRDGPERRVLKGFSERERLRAVCFVFTSELTDQSLSDVGVLF